MNQNKLNNLILVVDDEKDIVQAYLDFLDPPKATAKKSSRLTGGGASQSQVSEGPEFEILKAYSGEDALAFVKRALSDGRRVAGGFFDVKMEGGIDGIQTIQEVWKLDPEVHCTIVTAYQDRSVQDIGQLFGERFKDQWDFLNKPFTSGEIIQKGRQMVAAWNRMRELENALIQLRAAQAQLIRSERQAAIGQVARGIGHEFGNLLQTIVGKADLSIQSTDTAKIKSNLEMILKAAESAAVIVQNLQSFSKTGSKRQVMDLARTIKDSAALLSHDFKKHSIQVELATESAPVNGSSVELQQVFVNLMMNAIHAMPKGGAIRSGCKTAGDKCVSWVEDTGSGIAQEVLPHIFEYAFTTKGDKGSGLGLSISKQIVEGHGGAMTVRTEIGKGTRFEISFPKA